MTVNVVNGQDMGVYGTLFPIVEKNLIIQIKDKAHQMVESGEWDSIKNESIKKAKAKADRPADWDIPTATVKSERFFDPTIELKQDIRDHNGQLLYAAGTKINPLDYMNFEKTLIMFNADDANQVRYVSQVIKNELRDYVLILVGGSVHDAATALNRRVYVDQNGQYIERFGIRYVPSIIEVGGDKIIITEEPPNV